MQETPQVRKSLHKPYRYDNTIRSHREDMHIFLLMVLMVLIIVYATLTAYLTVYTSLYIVVICVVVIGGVFKIYNTFYHRYYRIIKRTEQRGQKDDLVYYIVQSCISRKKPEKIASKKNVKWKNTEEFYNSYGKKDAEDFFDRKTIENKGSETVISQIRKSIYKPKCRDKFSEKNNVHISTLIVPSILLVIALIVISLKLLISYLPSNMSTSIFILGYFGMYAVLISFVVTARILYVWKTHRYIRLVERTVWQGRYKKTTYILQSFISRKKLEEITHRKNIKWKHYAHPEFKTNLSKKDAEYYFDKDTTEKRVIEEVL